MEHLIEIQLGPLALFGEKTGEHVHVTVRSNAAPRGNRPLCGAITVTDSEFAALRQYADEHHAFGIRRRGSSMRADDRALVPPSVLRSLEGYVQQGIPTGDCLRAILSGELFEAFTRADPFTTLAMPAIVRFIRDELPLACYGSADRVDRWLQHHRERREAERKAARES